jgi:hypothetical protein
VARRRPLTYRRRIPADRLDYRIRAPCSEAVEQMHLIVFTCSSGTQRRTPNPLALRWLKNVAIIYSVRQASVVFRKVCARFRNDQMIGGNTLPPPPMVLVRIKPPNRVHRHVGHPGSIRAKGAAQG